MQFEEVYMIALPERTDRRDAFAVQAALSRISYTHIDGVDGSKVPREGNATCKEAKKSNYACRLPGGNRQWSRSRQLLGAGVHI